MVFPMAWTHKCDRGQWSWRWKNLCSNELFPNKRSFVIFVAYMAFSINHGLLITTSQKSDGSYAYNVTTVVLFTDVIKLITAFALQSSQSSWRATLQAVTTYKRVLLLYFIPALLYCFYNNLAFVNLTAFDPTTYFLLMQLRVVLTGFLFQCLFKRRLSLPQWLCLLLLTMGCVIKEFDWDWMVGLSTSGTSDSPIAPTSKYVEASISLNFLFHLALVILQVFCSCMAGVYCEYLLKDGGGGCPLMIQNVFMYLDSIISNVVLLLIMAGSATGNASAAAPFPLSWSAIAGVFERPLLIAIMFNSAAAGLVTSLFLKNFNSILKTFASALELGFTAVLSAILFAIPLDIPTAFSILIVCIALYFYSKKPVNNKHEDQIVSSPRESTV